MNENSISEKINRATEKLQAAGIDTPRLDAEVLLAHVLNCRRLSLYVNSAEELSPEKIGRYEALIEKRAEHLPVAYLTGVKEFMGMKFAVTPEILIPRPDTEILAQGIIERLLLDLSCREKKILVERFGINGGKPKTLEQIGKETGFSKERIRQIESLAVSKLRHSKQKNRMRDYLN